MDLNAASARAIAVVALVVSGMSVPGGAADNEDRRSERVAYFSVDGFKGSAYHVNIRGTQVLYRGGPSYDEASTRWRTLTLSDNKIEEFMGRLEKLGVFGWSPQYICPWVADGVGWRVEIRWNGRKVAALGSNKFPDRFDDVQKLISQLVREPFGVPVSKCSDDSSRP